MLERNDKRVIARRLRAGWAAALSAARKAVRDSTHPKQAVALFWLPFAYWWIRLMWNLGEYTWGHGVSTFIRLMVLLAIFVIARPINRRLERWLPWTSRIPSFLVGLALVLATVPALRQWKDDYLLYVNHPYDGLLDIGANTLKAADYFIQGDNPYAERCQTWYQITQGPNITVRDGEVRMFGIPYSYGYAYFPAMFLAYVPFWMANPDNDAVRQGNLVFSILCFLALIWLTVRLVPRGSRFAAGALAACIWLHTTKLTQQLYCAGVTDVVILAFALGAFLALSYGRHFGAGLLLGLAQASKLLPGPFLLIPVLLWGRHRRTNRRLLLGYGIPPILFILPFLLWNPPAFVSATVLYYATFHGTGDSTALWYHLPQPFQLPFLLIGMGLTTAIVLLALRTKGKAEGSLGLSYPLTLAFCAYVTFIAFSKMSHLNYLWGVYGLGCVALACRLAGGVSRSTAPGIAR